MNKVNLQIGDKVKIINYGHIMVINKNIWPIPIEEYSYPIIKDYGWWCIMDISRELVGMKGIITDELDGSYRVYIKKLKSSIAWFCKKQLKKIK